MNIKAASLTPEQALAELEARYEASVTALRKAIGDYIDHNTLPDTEARAEGLFVYPQLSVSWDGADHKALKTRAWGRFTHAGCYTTTITNPKLFRNYLLEQLTLLYQDYGAHISVELSQHEIPYPYVIDGSTLTLDRSMSAGLTRYFPTTELSQIGDETADGLFHPTEFYPLSHFDARRVDFRWRVCDTTPARRRNTSSPTCCSPTIPATWMSSSAGAAARSSIPTAPISLSPAPAGSGSPPRPKRRNRPFPIWRGRSTRCRPGI